MISQLILALAILVSLHEWGHYIAARIFGIRVEKFFIFFDAYGVKLFSKKIKDTEWGIGWLPLGGYVKIAGMIDESLDKDQMNSEPKPDEFRGKPAWQRLIVMVGGVTINLILGILIFSLMFWHYGDPYLPNDAVVNGNGIMVTELGAYAGFQNGDKIIEVNGNNVVKFKELVNPNHLLENGEISYTVLREGEPITIKVDEGLKTKLLESKGEPLFDFRFSPYVGGLLKGSNADNAGLEAGDLLVTIDSIPIQFYDQISPVFQALKNNEVAIKVKRESEILDLIVMVDEEGKIGFYPTNSFDYQNDIVTLKYGLLESFPAGAKKGFNTLGTQIKAFGALITGKINPTKSLMGPIQMTKLFGPVWDWQKFWALTGLFSLILAFMNILPIPALDGGHVVFLVIEMIIGRPLPDKFMYAMQIVGMVILFSLMAFVFGIDILSFFR